MTAGTVFPNWSERISVFQGEQGRNLSLRGKNEQAEALLLSSYSDLGAKLGPSSPSARKLRRYLFDLYTAWGKREEVEQYRSSP